MPLSDLDSGSGGRRTLSQEDMILAQAESNVLTLEPRLRVTRECIECLEAGFKSAENWGIVSEPLVSAIAQVQLTQLRAALVELEDSLSKSKEVIQQITDQRSSKIFRPTVTP